MANCVLLTRSIGGVPIDVIMTEVHEASLEIARNPLEVGAEVTDHAYINPKRVTLTGVTAGHSAGLRRPDRVGAAETWRALIRVQETREPFTLITGLKRYPSMMIERLEALRDTEFAHVLDFTAELVEIIFSHAFKPELGSPLEGSPADRRLGGVTDRGLSPNRDEDVPEAVEDKVNRSLLLDLEELAQ